METIEVRKSMIIGDEQLWVVDNYAGGYVQPDGTNGTYHTYDTEFAANAAHHLYLENQAIERTIAKLAQEPTEDEAAMREFDGGAPRDKLIPVSHKNYMALSDAYDEHSRNLMGLKGEEYSIDGDFLAMENRLAGMLGDSPEYVSLVMAGKHITALGIILLKNDVDKIKLKKLDERVRDACNLLKITAAFVHAKQNDFSLHLGKEEKQETKPGYGGDA